MKIKVSREWLKACGRNTSLDTFEVIRIQNMPAHNEKIYHVADGDNREWAIWSIRGVTEIEDSSPLDTLVSDIATRIADMAQTRIHMLNEGMKTQKTALQTAAFQAGSITESTEMLAKHAAIGKLTRHSHGLVIDQLIKESTSVMAQLIAIAHKMEAE